MKILSSHIGNTWLEVRPLPQAGDEANKQRDVARDEIKRVLSDCFRCNSLVVLTGLGTSLHVNLDNDMTDMIGDRTELTGKKIAPMMSDLWKKSEEKSAENFDHILRLSRFPKDDKKYQNNIEALLSYCKIGADFTDDEEEKTLILTFIANTEKIIRDEVNFLDDGDDVPVHSELLRKISRRSNRKVRTKIFTTNYDLCFEYAARQGRYVVIDGFSHTSPQVFDSIYFNHDIVRREANPDTHDFITNVFHLYKLHGSIDWQKSEKTHEIERVANTEKPVLVYPRNTKYELAFEQPYIEMMSAFQTAIRQPETALLIVGFGFNDNHLAEPIMSAIRSNQNLKVVIVDPFLAPRGDKPGSAAMNTHLKKVAYLISKGDARLSLLNATFEDLVPELPDIAADTDLEQHLDRMKALRALPND